MNFLYYRTLTNDEFPVKLKTNDEFPVLSNVSKLSQFSCYGFICVLHHGRIARLTEHDDVIKPLLRGASRLGLALGPAPAKAGLASML